MLHKLITITVLLLLLVTQSEASIAVTAVTVQTDVFTSVNLEDAGERSWRKIHFCLDEHLYRVTLIFEEYHASHFQRVESVGYIRIQGLPRVLYIIDYGKFIELQPIY